MAFPTNPSPGDSYTDEYGTVWVYAGTVNGWYRQTVTTPNDTSYTAAISGPAGSNTQVQFNDNGELAGDSGLTYNKTTDALSGGAFIPTGSTIPSNGVYLPSANTVALSTNGAGRLFVDASGNVGVGVNPSYRLHTSIYGSNYLYLDNTRGPASAYIGVLDSETQFVVGGAHPLTFATNSTERARIDGSGRLLVGTSTSLAQNGSSVAPGLQLTGGDQARAAIHRNSADGFANGLTIGKARGASYQILSPGDQIGYVYFSGADGNVTRASSTITSFVEGTPAAGSIASRLVFSTTADGASSPTPRMTISANGDITFNNGPSASLYFEGSASTSNYACYHRRDNTAYTIAQSSDSRALRIGSGSGWTTTGVSLAAGATSWGTYSDERLKKDIIQLDNTLATLDGIRCITYRLNTDESDSKKRLGVIAQDLIGKYDEALNQSKRTEDDPTEYYSVQYSDLVPVLLSALQEAKQRIEALEAEVTALKAS